MLNGRKKKKKKKKKKSEKERNKFPRESASKMVSRYQDRSIVSQSDFPVKPLKADVVLLPVAAIFLKCKITFHFTETINANGPERKPTRRRRSRKTRCNCFGVFRSILIGCHRIGHTTQNDIIFTLRINECNKTFQLRYLYFNKLVMDFITLYAT